MRKCVLAVARAGAVTAHLEVLMEFHPPSDLAPFQVLFDSSESHAGLPEGLVRFAGNIGFPQPPPQRPWVYANFVQSIDGIVSFGGTRPGGEWIARSRHDRWMMDLLRAHADALICGSHSLIVEARYGKISGGPVYRIVDPELLQLRQQVLRKDKLKIIVVTGSGTLRPEEYRLFHSEHVDAWIATTPEGSRFLGGFDRRRLLVSGEGTRVDFHSLFQLLREEHGVRYLLCEGGPRLYGAMLRAEVVDEKFLTISPQEIGLEPPLSSESVEQQSNEVTNERLTSVSGPGLTVETARWYQWISSRRAGDHEFNRYRARPEGSAPPASIARL